MRCCFTPFWNKLCLFKLLRPWGGRAGLLFVRNPSSHQTSIATDTTDKTTGENQKMKITYFTAHSWWRVVGALEETTVTCFARRVSWSARFEEMTSSYVLDKCEIMWDNAEMGHVVGGKIRPGLWHVLGAFHRTWILTTTGVGQIVVTRYFLLLRNPPHCNLPSHSENNWDNPQTSRTKIWNV